MKTILIWCNVLLQFTICPPQAYKVTKCYFQLVNALAFPPFLFLTRRKEVVVWYCAKPKPRCILLCLIVCLDALDVTWQYKRDLSFKIVHIVRIAMIVQHLMFHLNVIYLFCKLDFLFLQKRSMQWFFFTLSRSLPLHLLSKYVILPAIIKTSKNVAQFDPNNFTKVVIN